jgi:geranylgeranyl diphosphate synthase type I
MTTEKKLMERVITLLEERGQKAVDASKQLVLQEEITYEPLKEALRYFMTEFWFDVLHPALISIACEAVGGNPDETVDVGAAIVLLAGAADIHDDIIDQSTVKEPMQTVFGKFGRDTAILAGDALLLKGAYALYDACENLSKDKKQEILSSVKCAFFEVSSGEAREASLRGRLDISGQDYLDIIRQKVAAAEATTRIGAILGGGTNEDIDVLGHYGRTYGVLMTLRDEFIDIFEPDEVKNRFSKECLPLPVLLALNDDSRRKEILELLKEEKGEKNIDKILDLSIESEETQELLGEMKRLVENEVAILASLKHCRDILELLLHATLEDL